LKGSIKIARLFGVPVLLHGSFLLVLALAVFWGCQGGMAGYELLWWGLFGLAVFISILLHEFGHVLMARRFGVETIDIVLLPIGGLARLSRLPDKPLHEFLVAVAGPLVNVGIAFVLAPFFWFVTKPALMEHDIPAPSDIDEDFFFFLPLIMFLNVLLAVFNMIPAFPMDGGRILRALLSINMSKLNATKIAVAIGQVVAVVLVVVGFWVDHYTYAFIGVFISYTSIREFRWVRSEHLLAGHKVADAFDAAYPVLTEQEMETLGVQAFDNKENKHFLIVDDQGVLAGIYSKPVERGEQECLFRLAADVLSVEDSLKEANEIMAEKKLEVIPVMDGEKLVGALEMEMVWDHLSAADRMNGHSDKIKRNYGAAP